MLHFIILVISQYTTHFVKNRMAVPNIKTWEVLEFHDNADHFPIESATEKLALVT